jgi:hypothetical protein
MIDNTPIQWLEINIVQGRRTRLRADRIIEMRDDWQAIKKGGDRTPIVRIIMEGGTNVVAVNETMKEVWDRLQEALQRKFYICEAPHDGPIVEDDT